MPKSYKDRNIHRRIESRKTLRLVPFFRASFLSKLDMKYISTPGQRSLQWHTCAGHSLVIYLPGSVPSLSLYALPISPSLSSSSTLSSFVFFLICPSLQARWAGLNRSHLKVQPSPTPEPANPAEPAAGKGLRARRGLSTTHLFHRRDHPKCPEPLISKKQHDQSLRGFTIHAWGVDIQSTVYIGYLYLPHVRGSGCPDAWRLAENQKGGRNFFSNSMAAGDPKLFPASSATRHGNPRAVPVEETAEGRPPGVVRR